MRIYQQSFGSSSAYSTYADVLTSINYNSYSPTLTGTGASGTWSINVTGTAASISGYNNPTTAATANTIVYRDSNAYIFAQYFNAPANSDSPLTYAPTSIIGRASASDKYYYDFSAGAIQSFLGLGSNAYTSTAYLPLAGGTMTGSVYWNTASYAIDLQNTSYIRFSNSGGGTRWGYIQGTSTAIAFAADSLPITFSSTNFTLNSAGAATFSSTIAASNFSGTSSGTNTGDQTNISGNAATATTATNWSGYNAGLLNWSTGNGTSTSGQNRMAARLYSLGRKIYLDETFNYGANSLNVYDNNSTGTVSITRVSAPYSVSTSGYQVQIQHTGASQSPGYGGFYFATGTRSNATFACVFRAKIPSGYTLNCASNAIGTGGNNYWATDNIGTGKYEDYVYVVRCGDSGTFSSTMFFYITGSPAPSAGSPLTWYLSSATVYDVDDRDNTNTQGYTPLTSNNYNSYAPTLIGGGASGTWGINVTGTAASETLATVTGRGASTSTAIIFSSSLAVGNSSHYDSSQFSLDVNGGVLIKNTGKSAQLILQNANPAVGGNNGFVQHLVGGTTTGAFASIQTYYGTSVAAGTLQLQPNGGSVTIGGNTVLTAGNYNSYSPTLTGGSASGTWGINITGTAGSISGYNNPTTAATANTIVYRDASGHITGNYGLYSYVNTSDDVSAGTITYIMAKFGDNYHRSATAAKVQTFLGLGSNAYTSTAYALLNGSTSNDFSINSIIYASTAFNPSAAARTTTSAMSIKMWNNYFNGTGLGSDYGTVLEYYSLSGHVDTQVYFDAGGGSWYRTAS
jgi:hypothetical protein